MTSASAWPQSRNERGNGAVERRSGRRRGGADTGRGVLRTDERQERKGGHTAPVIHGCDEPERAGELFDQREVQSCIGRLVEVDSDRCHSSSRSKPIN